MTNNDHFYSHFPSLNSNSKENQRNKRISREFSEYMRNLKVVSPKQTKQQQRISRSRLGSRENVSGSSSELSSPSMDIIFSGEDRNRYEDEQKEEKRREYQIGLERQIAEQRLKRKKEAERLKREEMLLEQRLQRQIADIKLQKDSQAEKIVERFEDERSFTEGRISLSENEKESHNASKLSNNSKSSSNNEVYRYFSHSAKVDSDLFNYKKYFNDIMLEQRQQAMHQPHEHSHALKPSKHNNLASKQPEEKTMPKESEIDNCPSCKTHTECSRCHRKLEMFCKECNEQHEKVSPETTNQLQIEYNPPELPFTSDQQVVVYRADNQHAPYSFNIEPESMFYKDTLDQMRQLNELKLANYIKLYGDLRKQTLVDKLKDVEQEVHPRPTGAIPKQPRASVEQIQGKNFTQTPNNGSDIDDIINSAQYTVITQIGFAKKQFELERNKL